MLWTALHLNNAPEICMPSKAGLILAKALWDLAYRYRKKQQNSFL